AVLEDQQMSRQQFVDAADERVGAGGVPGAQDLGKDVDVGFRFDQLAGEKRFYLRSEEQRVSRARPVQRLDAEPIPHEQEPSSWCVPDRKGEHAPKSMDAV